MSVSEPVQPCLQTTRAETKSEAFGNSELICTAYAVTYRTDGKPTVMSEACDSDSAGKARAEIRRESAVRFKRGERDLQPPLRGEFDRIAGVDVEGSGEIQ